MVIWFLALGCTVGCLLFDLGHGKQVLDLIVGILCYLLSFGLEFLLVFHEFKENLGLVEV